MESPSRARDTFGRRSALRLFALAPAAVALTTACTPTAEEPDPLLAAATAARKDAALAEAVARAHTGLAEQAGEVAAARKAHAQALQREIDRMNPPDPDKPPSVPDPGPQRAPASAEQATAALAESLRSAKDRLGGMVPALPPYRAGLAGSISASCACLLEVLS
ncbi:hypothetical protein A8924_6275 [Saccharopolyspora erythraea NRRL 2338]|uniref:Uncharacterized protein n=2 Tax=Saccharopolyspora erythraea TaxID=1836 RepID=A4FM37_SACEN|nr:hypothetical protein [Saccharopolyspora erythraea]EQD84597.1 hypothetical protein N599_19100 [Saccharopolyspora erythraea D]PFG98751.1 hypothetical protein A8924_6275 [Saccharopolyspora erythraea NRRL 2338]QRK88758.1 hypothetical protein JQX30_29705 [Saccharopolyspora erythraea]CAM05112.1 hypothetical protein SACE_5929 [Saccharopolyspora erythraea NRRL 2338]